MNEHIEVAKRIKKGKTASGDNYYVGEIVKLAPLKIKIFGGAAFLNADELVYTAAARSREISIGTKIILIPINQGYSEFLFLDVKG